MCVVCRGDECESVSHTLWDCSSIRAQFLRVNANGFTVIVLPQGDTHYHRSPELGLYLENSRTASSSLTHVRQISSEAQSHFSNFSLHVKQ